MSDVVLLLSFLFFSYIYDFLYLFLYILYDNVAKSVLRKCSITKLELEIKNWQNHGN